MEIGVAKKILTSYNKGLAKAKAAQLKDIQEANEIRDNEIYAAEEKRHRAAEKEEDKYRKAKDQGFSDAPNGAPKSQSGNGKTISRRFAVNRWPSSGRCEKPLISDTRRQLLWLARPTTKPSSRPASSTSRLFKDILAEERYAFERASQTVERMLSSAVVAYERAVADEEARMRNEIAKHPEARKIQEAHDRQLAKTRRDCERKKEALFKKFTANRKRLST